MLIRTSTGLFALTAALGALACGDDNEPVGPGGTGGADVQAGTTAVVAVLNPVVNEAHTTGEPAELGPERDGIAIDAEPGDNAVTANDGLAVMGVPAGPIQLLIGTAPGLAYTVAAEGDLYDAAIAYDGAGAAFFTNTPIRYAVGAASGAVFFDPQDDVATIDARLDEDDLVVVLRPGTYVGDLSITGGGVILFGEGWSERSVIIDGSITAAGEGVRVRGLTVTGGVTASGNNFGISFSVVKGAVSITGNAGAYLRNVFCGAATVPSSNATLLDNYGIEPQLTPPPGVCD